MAEKGSIGPDVSVLDVGCGIGTPGVLSRQAIRLPGHRHHDEPERRRACARPGARRGLRGSRLLPAARRDGQRHARRIVRSGLGARSVAPDAAQGRAVRRMRARAAARRHDGALRHHACAASCRARRSFAARGTSCTSTTRSDTRSSKPSRPTASCRRRRPRRCARPSTSAIRSFRRSSIGAASSRRTATRFAR